MRAHAAPKLRSVQIRTTVVATITVAVVLVLGSIALVGSFHHQQLRQVDARLTATAKLISSPSTDRASLPASSAGDALVQLVDDQDQVRFAGDRLRDQPAMRSVTDGAAGTPITATVAGVGSVRVIAVPFEGNWLLFAETLGGVDDAVSGLIAALVIGVPILTLLLGTLVWIVVGRTLRPVSEAMGREKRLIEDVSHELRTPLAGARALLESESQDPAEIELNRLEALAALARLEVLAEDLLIAARNDEGAASRVQELVDLDDVVVRVADRVSRPESIDLDLTAVSAGQVRGNELDLERMVANLLTNAFRHATTRVEVALDESGTSVVLSVVDDGPGIAPEDRARVFDRFTRLDDARSRSDAGAGLGLPIVQSVVAAHGGTVVVGDAAIGGAAFVVTMPSSTETPTPGPGGARVRAGGGSEARRPRRVGADSA